jgi:prevent-host-death family protein
MSTVNVHDAKTHLSALLQRVENGEEVLIARDGQPIARLVPYQKHEPRVPGIWKDKLIIQDDFDAPLPEDILKAFEGRGDGE